MTLAVGVLISSASSASSTTLVPSPFTMPAEALAILDVVTYRAAGSPSIPTVVGTGGEVWVQIGTRVMAGATTRRLTRFRAMRLSSTLTTITITCGTTQTDIGAVANYITGVETVGINGSGAIGQVILGDTFASTSLNLPSPSFQQTVNGAYAAFATVNGGTALSPRAGYSEVQDFQIGSSANRLETQFRANSLAGDYNASASGPLTEWAGITCEILVPRPFLNTGVLTNGSLGTVSSAPTSSFTIPERTLILLDVLTVNATPATPTLTGTGGETWVQVQTRSQGTRRLTRFRTLRTSDTTTIVTIDCGGASQTRIGWAASWVGGAAITGTHGSGAVAQVVGNDSGGSSVTSLTISLAAMGDARNGAFAVFVAASSTNAITPRTGWEEGYDFVAGAGVDRFETQFYAVNDSAASCSGAASSAIIGIACEIVAVSTPARMYAMIHTEEGKFLTSPQVFNVVLLKGYINFIHANTNVSSSPPTISTSGVTWLLVFSDSYANGYVTRVWTTTVPVDIETTVTVTITGGAYLSFISSFVGPIDTSVLGGAGVLQQKTLPVVAATPGGNVRTVVFDNPVQSESVAVLFVGGNNNASLFQPGWQRVYLSAGGGSSAPQGGFWRANVDSAPDVFVTNPGEYSGIAFELKNEVAISDSNAIPVVTYVIPPEGLPTYRHTVVTFTVTMQSVPDPTVANNLHLRRVLVRAIYADRDGWDFIHDGTNFGPQFQGPKNGRVLVDVPGKGKGYQFTTLRDDGWPSPPKFTVYAVSVLGDEA